MKQLKSNLPKIPKAIFVFRDDICNAQGESPIYIAYNIERRTAKVTTGIFLEPKYWDFKRSKVRQSHPRHEQLNSYLQLKRHELDTRILDAITETELNITVDTTHKFDKELKRCIKRGLDMSKFKECVKILSETGKLPIKYRPISYLASLAKHGNAILNRTGYWFGNKMIQN